ncbi:hypothetical protein MN116_006652, partial [Schistosoma mekongi]
MIKGKKMKKIENVNNNFNENLLNNNNNKQYGNNAFYLSINCHVDRHHGWYTERIPVDKQFCQYKKRPCDYIVQTNYVANRTDDLINNKLIRKENENDSPGKLKLFPSINVSNTKVLNSCKSEKFRVNLILRLRSIWSRSLSRCQRLESKHVNKTLLNCHRLHQNHHHHHQQQQQQNQHQYLQQHHLHHQSQQCKKINKKYTTEKSIKSRNYSHEIQSLNNSQINQIKLDKFKIIKQTSDNLLNEHIDTTELVLSKRYHSESCLLQPYILHNPLNICPHIHYHLQICSKSSFIIKDKHHSNYIMHQLPELKLQSSTIKHSLSTGNICCLYRLKCVPSIECITHSLSTLYQQEQEQQQQQHQSLHKEHRCSSLPTTSIMMKSRNKSKLMSPYYHVSERHLGKWIQKMLKNDHIHENHSENNDNNQDDDDDDDNDNDDDNEEEEEEKEEEEERGSDNIENIHNTNHHHHHKNKNQLLNITNYWNYKRLSHSLKHVHFADESRYSSATTLNSLSRSSSLSSLNVTNNSSSPVTCCCSLCPCSIDANNLVNDKISEQKLISKENHLNNVKLDEQHLLKRNSSTPKINSTNNTTPLVTVNLFHNESDPPEVPVNVLNRLQTEKKWEPTFINPILCINFNQRLLEQKVCLSQFHSYNLYTFYVQVKILTNQQINNNVNEVKLRYTLDKWKTFIDSPRLHHLNHLNQTLLCNHNHDDGHVYQWIETYELDIMLSINSMNDDVNYQQLEFAI